MSYDDSVLDAQLDFIAGGRASRRYHTMEMLEYQRIDAHSFGVAMFTTILTPGASSERRARLLMAALVHDLPEHMTGDMPAPFKRAVPGLRDTMGVEEDKLLDEVGLLTDLDDADARVLKIADAADGAYHCIVERDKGNKFASVAFKNFMFYLDALGLYDAMRSGARTDYEAGERALRRWLDRRWLSANGGKW